MNRRPQGGLGGSTHSGLDSSTPGGRGGSNPVTSEIDKGNKIEYSRRFIKKFTTFYAVIAACHALDVVLVCVQNLYFRELFYELLKAPRPSWTRFGRLHRIFGARYVRAIRKGNQAVHVGCVILMWANMVVATEYVCSLVNNSCAVNRIAGHQDDRIKNSNVEYLPATWIDMPDIAPFILVSDAQLSARIEANESVFAAENSTVLVMSEPQWFYVQAVNVRCEVGSNGTRWFRNLHHMEMYAIVGTCFPEKRFDTTTAMRPSALFSEFS